MSLLITTTTAALFDLARIGILLLGNVKIDQLTSLQRLKFARNRVSMRMYSNTSCFFLRATFAL